jgi:hypothetical protein
MALPATLEPATAVRSTLLLSSIAALTEAGYGELYFKALPVEYHFTLRNAVVGSWIPIAVGMAHYSACVSLGLSREAIVRIGRSVGDKVKGTLLGTVARMAKEVGVTPLNVIPQFPRFWSRAFNGGGCSAHKVGPKEVRIEAHKAEVLDSPYFRSSLCGLAMGVLDPFCTRAYMVELPGPRPPMTAIYRIQWA